MKKENIFLVDIYQISNPQKATHFNCADCEIGHISAEETLIVKEVPVVKFYNSYVPLQHIKTFKHYLALKLKDNDTISYKDSRFLDTWIHIYASYNQKIVKNIRPAFKEKGNIGLTKLLQYFQHTKAEELQM